MPLTWEQAQYVLGKLQHIDYCHARLWAVLMYTGRRISDVIDLRFDDIQDQQGQSVFVIRERKTRKPATITIHPALMDVLKHDGPQTGYILSSRHIAADKPLTIRQCQRIIASVSELCDLPTLKPCPTMLRKTFARALYDRFGIDIVSQALNHRDNAVTRRYIGIYDDDVQAAYLSL